MNDTPKLLHLEDVYKSYGEKLVLENVDLAVREGTFCSVVGPSGCGKSTLFRIVLGQEFPTAGRALLNGAPISKPDTDRGIVYQRYSLYPNLTVLDNVRVAKTLRLGLSERWSRRAEIRDKAHHFLERVGLNGHDAKYPHELSGGMQQRVAIAQALMGAPRILLMDEPFGALDPQTREAMQVFLLELWEKQKMTIFFVTHDMEEAIYLGDRVLVLSQHYTDDRGHGANVKRGSRIVADYALPHAASSTKVKSSREFIELVGEIKRLGFDPQELRHVDQFNLSHPDAFRTLTAEESRRQNA